MGTLNVANLNHTGTLVTNQVNTHNIKTYNGQANIARHEPRMGSTLLTGVTWHTSDDEQTQLIGNISNAGSVGCYAIIVTLYYSHNGSTNHGYLTGYFHQTGKPYNTHGTWFNSYHYDWYYNVITSDYVVKWDPNGTQSLSMYNSYSYNTSTSNTFSFYHSGNLFAGA
jgi:hypothetical protein